MGFLGHGPSTKKLFQRRCDIVEYFFWNNFFWNNFWTPGGSGRALYGQESNDLLDFGNPKTVDTKFQQVKLESCRS